MIDEVEKKPELTASKVSYDKNPKMQMRLAPVE
jgi:hypothetical protein